MRTGCSKISFMWRDIYELSSRTGSLYAEYLQSLTMRFDFNKEVFNAI